MYDMLTRHATNSCVLHVTAGIGKFTLFQLKYMYAKQIGHCQKRPVWGNV